MSPAAALWASEEAELALAPEVELLELEEPHAAIDTPTAAMARVDPRRRLFMRRFCGPGPERLLKGRAPCSGGCQVPGRTIRACVARARTGTRTRARPVAAAPVHSRLP